MNFSTKTMKKLLRIILTLAATYTATAQTYTHDYSTEPTYIEIYSSINGVKNLTPDKILKQTGNTTEVYNVENGIQQITPEKVIIGNEIYNVTNGVRDLTPEGYIEEEDENQ
jgi:hypothetical protein